MRQKTVGVPGQGRTLRSMVTMTDLQKAKDMLGLMESLGVTHARDAFEDDKYQKVVARLTGCATYQDFRKTPVFREFRKLRTPKTECPRLPDGCRKCEGCTTIRYEIVPGGQERVLYSYDGCGGVFPGTGFLCPSCSPKAPASREVEEFIPDDSESDSESD